MYQVFVDWVVHVHLVLRLERSPAEARNLREFFERSRRKTVGLKPAGISASRSTKLMGTKTTERAALLNQLQSARLLGVSPASMRRMVAAGAVEPVRIAGLGRPRFRRSDVEALIRDGRAP